jgi:hypothetical protein
MDKKVFFDLLYVILIVSLIFFMIFVVYYLKDNSKDCLKDPINYFESKNEGASCYCYKEENLHKITSFMDPYDK